MSNKIFTLFILFLVGGCQGVANLRLNDELTSLYSAKLNAAAIDDVILYETALDSLESISELAKSEAVKARTTADAVSFYRIAATAAWQAESWGTVGGLAEAGWSRCESPDFDRNRRDCVMLLVIPDLAAIDVLSLSLEVADSAINAEINKSLSDRQSEVLDAQATAAKTLFDSYKNRFDALRRAEDEFPADEQPPALLVKLRGNTDFVYCRMREARVLVILASDAEDERFQSADSQFAQVRDEYDPDEKINCD